MSTTEIAAIPTEESFVSKKQHHDTTDDHNASPQEPQQKKMKPAEEEGKDNASGGSGYASRNKPKAMHPGSYAHPEFRAWRQIDDTLPPQPTTTTNKKTVKRKVAMLIGYKGTKYGGFQINIGQRTLQSEIEFALYKVGFLRVENFGYPQKYSWSTSGRTDKGVHAAAQTISCKIELEDDATTMDTVRERMNAALEGTDITVLGVERTTRMFCAKKNRDRVRYRYILPSFLLDPQAQELLKAKVQHSTAGDSLDDINNDATATQPAISPQEIEELWPHFQSVRSTPTQRELLSSTLAQYEGTHSFHNFTKGVAPTEARAKRYIVNFKVHDPILHAGIEWIPTSVLGQSFLLHQIRKMIGCAVAVVQGAAPPTFLRNVALSPQVRQSLPTAPAQGLFLEMSFYDLYNKIKRQRNNSTVPDLVWNATEGPLFERWSQCVADISAHIMQEERESGNFVQYLYAQTCGRTSQFPDAWSAALVDDSMDGSDTASKSNDV